LESAYKIDRKAYQYAVAIVQSRQNEYDHLLEPSRKMASSQEAIE
jgi:hypothetical protein